MQSPLCWMGGKSNLRKTIIPMIPQHKTYVEAFAGAAWVLFGKDPKMSRVEVLNDIDGELINFYRVLKRRANKFLNGFEWLLVSREVFNELKKVDPSRLSPEERAVRFFFLVKASILAKQGTFSTSPGRRPAVNLEKLEAMVRAVHDRLKGVTIERLDFEKLIRLYDRRETFFYLDPPYWGMRHYTFNFTEEQHERLAEVLGAIKGRFILSYNDVRPIRRLYKGHKLQKVNPRYTAQSVSGRTAMKGNELLIRNF